MKYLIQILMIQTPHHSLFDMGKVHHHSICIQHLRTAINCNNPIVTMQILAFTSIRKIQAVRSRYFHSLNYCIHHFSLYLERTYT